MFGDGDICLELFLPARPALCPRWRNLSGMKNLAAWAKPSATEGVSSISIRYSFPFHWKYNRVTLLTSFFAPINWLFRSSSGIVCVPRPTLAPGAPGTVRLQMSVWIRYARIWNTDKNSGCMDSNLLSYELQKLLILRLCSLKFRRWFVNSIHTAQEVYKHI